MRRVFVDTSVLFPFSVMDRLLALSEDAIHEVLWTDDLLDEWERALSGMAAPGSYDRKQDHMIAFQIVGALELPP